MNLEKIAGYLNLGSMIDSPKEVSGGLLHKMYAVSTTTGKYAVKVLNSEIMKRPQALQNTINSEKIACALSKDIPVVASVCVNGNHIHQLDGDYYMVFPWVEGKSVFAPKIGIAHCRIIGDVLGKIHQLGIRLDGVETEEDDIIAFEWEHFLKLAVEQKLQDKEWFQNYKKSINDIKKWNTEACNAQNRLSLNRVISHRDLDPKNVMWNELQVYLIDWEAAGYVNPYQELLEVINYWASDEKGNIQKEYFDAILESYKIHKDIKNVEWERVLAGSYIGMLGWLEYNVKRALGIETVDSGDVEHGEEQVVGTIKELYRYQTKAELIKEWLLNDKSCDRV